MKKIIYVLMLLGATSSYAQQNVVYRCVDASGSVSYLNSTAMSKDAGCQKTDLADPEKVKGMVIRVENANKELAAISAPTLTSTNVRSTAPVIKSDEQKKKDEGRFSILTKELEDEQEQLTSVQKMIKNVETSKDTEQISKLKNMENRHLKNIGALKKELGIKGETTVAEATKTSNNANQNFDNAFNAMMIKKEIKMNPTIVQVSDTTPTVSSKITVAPKVVSTPVFAKSIKQVNSEPVIKSKKMDENPTATIESFLKLR